MQEPTIPTSARLELFLRRWLAANPGWPYATGHGPYSRLRAPEDVARAILADAEFAEVRLAGWFTSPDGDLVQAVARTVLPVAPAAEIDLLVEAVTRAAAAHQRGREQVAAIWTVAAAAVAVLLVRPLLRGARGVR